MSDYLLKIMTLHESCVIIKSKILRTILNCLSITFNELYDASEKSLPDIRSHDLVGIQLSQFDQINILLTELEALCKKHDELSNVNKTVAEIKDYIKDINKEKYIIKLSTNAEHHNMDEIINDYFEYVSYIDERYIKICDIIDSINIPENPLLQLLDKLNSNLNAITECVKSLHDNQTN